jgi:hypothetical protein
MLLIGDEAIDEEGVDDAETRVGDCRSRVKVLPKRYRMVDA